MNVQMQRSNQQKQNRWVSICGLFFILMWGFLMGLQFARYTQMQQQPNHECPKVDTAAAASSIRMESSEPTPNTLTTTKKQKYLELPPGTKGVILNVGSHADPVVPMKDKGIIVLAFEPDPVVGQKITPRDGLFVIPAAVSNEVGIGNFHFYNQGRSSSLAEVNDGHIVLSFKPGFKETGSVFYVPILTLPMIIDSIPPEIDILHIKTDMQGFDYTAILPAKDRLQARVLSICNEGGLWGRGEYKGVSNDIVLDHLPFYTSIGFLPDGYTRGEIKRATETKPDLSKPAHGYSGTWENPKFIPTNDWGMDHEALVKFIQTCKRCQCI